MQEHRLVMLIIRHANQQESAPAETLRNVKSFVERHSRNRYTIAFNNSDASCYGFILKTDSPLAVMRSELMGTQAFGTSAPSILLRGDTCLLLEIGEHCDGHGFTSALSFIEDNFR